MASLLLLALLAPGVGPVSHARVPVRLAVARSARPGKPVSYSAQTRAALAPGRIGPGRTGTGQADRLPAGVTHTVVVGGVTRNYTVFRPEHPLSPQVPALVVLHGRDEAVPLEERRDGLLPLVDQGRALLVYPTGYRESWNAGFCCGPAQSAGMNDLGFVTAVIAEVRRDPQVSSVILAGFSNGGRMAYRVACSRPDLVASMVVVDAVAAMRCPAGTPVSLLQMDGTRDPIVAYDAHVPPHVTGGYVEPSATAQVATWRLRDHCTTAVTATVQGTLHLQAWASCAGGTRVEFATYDGLGHAWPPGSAGTPSGADLLWAFVTAHAAPPAQAT